MVLMCLLSNVDRFREFDGDTCRLVVLLEPSVIGSVGVEEPLAFVVAACLIVLSGSKRSGSKAVSSPKRSSISTLGVFLCTIFEFGLIVSLHIDENDEPTDVICMARLLEIDEPEEKHLRLELSKRFKRKLVIVER